MNTVSISEFRNILNGNFDAAEPQNGVVKELSAKDYRSQPGLGPSDIKLASEKLGNYRNRGHLFQLAREIFTRHRDEKSQEMPPGMYASRQRKCLDFGALYHKVLFKPDCVSEEFIVLDKEAKAEIIAKRKERKMISPDYPVDFNPRWKQSVAAKKQFGRNLNDAEKKQILIERQAEFVGRLDEFSEHVPEYADWLDRIRQEGKTLITAENMEHALAMVDALHDLDENTVAGELMNTLRKRDCATEASLFYNLEYVDDLPSIQTKGRPDLLVDDIILDAKTCLCAHPKIFGRDVENYHYDTCMAMYLWLTEMLSGHPPVTGLNFPKKRVGFLAQEKQPPYLARIYWMPDDWLHYKKEEVQIELSRIARAWGLGEWSQDLMRNQQQELTPGNYLKNRIRNFDPCWEN
ncbi:MAG: PD-(D/E)XK nuclease-like domain-containing protein [Verrucomicrobiales bacterium]|nr:PD-(D/E)XK nuclease-like domain-containing protein [Verrucomicrobiales bacterium]